MSFNRLRSGLNHAGHLLKQLIQQNVIAQLIFILWNPGGAEKVEWVKSLGADAVIGGGGTLIPPPGGLTVTGAFSLDPTNAPTLTVSGPVTIGAGATITVTDPSLLDKKTSYRCYTATATSGTPELVGFPRGWMAMNDGVSLRVLYASGTTILFR